MLSVGGILQKQRINKGLTLHQIEKYTRIRERFLKAIEENDWNFFTSKIYITGIIKNYSRFLDLDEDKMLAFFRREYEKKEVIKFKRKVSSRFLISDSKKYITIFLIGIFVFFIAYFALQLRQYISPPEVVLISPTVSIFKRTDKIRIIGRTEKESTITLFGDRVYQNKEGLFEFDFPLSTKRNELILEVVGANGKKTIFKKEFIKIE